MLRSFIENRERAFHARDTNRRSSSFEWGLEHLGISEDVDPLPALRSYASLAVRESERFFAYQPGAEYAFDGHLLRFPSFIQTPYPENNTVYGRFFEAGRDLAVVVLPQWNCPWDGQVGLCRALQRYGVTSLRLSLPYHHHRKPVELERSEYLVSPNIGRTLTASRQAVVDTRRAADWLFAQGYRRVGVVGTSIGSCIGFLTFAHDERFACGVFIHVSTYFADVVWTGLSTSHVRKAFGGFLGLDELRELWAPISPHPFVRRLAGTTRPMLTLSGRYDLSFPVDLTRQALEEFERWRVPAERLWLPCGHYTMGQFPFNVMAGYRILRFLIRQREAGAGTNGRRG